jgi:putative transmembrane protein PGPGW
MLADVKDLARLFRRIAVTAVGPVILAVGVILLVAPGPGLVVIAFALAVSATEYPWARRRLAAVRERACGGPPGGSQPRRDSLYCPVRHWRHRLGGGC